MKKFTNFQFDLEDPPWSMIFNEIHNMLSFVWAACPDLNPSGKTGLGHPYNTMFGGGTGSVFTHVDMRAWQQWATVVEAFALHLLYNVPLPAQLVPRQMASKTQKDTDGTKGYTSLPAFYTRPTIPLEYMEGHCMAVQRFKEKVEDFNIWFHGT